MSQEMLEGSDAGSRNSSITVIDNNTHYEYKFSIVQHFYAAVRPKRLRMNKLILVANNILQSICY
jgi:hypothetical protein